VLASSESFQHRDGLGHLIPFQAKFGKHLIDVHLPQDIEVQRRVCCVNLTTVRLGFQLAAVLSLVLVQIG
jgi:hypothetical protein